MNTTPGWPHQLTREEEPHQTILTHIEASRTVHVHARALPMVLPLLAANTEHRLADQLDTHPQDHKDTGHPRNLLQLGGTITHIPHNGTVRLD